MEFRQLRVALALVLLAAPSAMAGWGAKGSFEPDTAFDAGGTWMTLSPDVTSSFGRHVVYFNGFSGVAGAATTSANPNLASLRTSYHTTPFLPVALFGVWKDCNNDGYVGLGDNGAFEYRTTLLLNQSICPAATPPAQTPWRVHNDGTWVVEFMPIGYDDTTTPQDENPLNLNDTTARVWADWGLPGDAPELACATYPAPYGTFRSTGGMLRWVDCLTGYRVVAAVNAVADATGQQSLSFRDAPPDRPDQSGSVLNQPNPWGSEGDAALVTVFDCSHAQQVEVRDPTAPQGQTGALRTLAAVPVGGQTVYVNGTDEQGRILNATVHGILLHPDPSGSPAGTVNETEAGLTDCDRSDTDEIVDLDGQRKGSDGDLPYALEGPNEPVSPYAPRSRTDHAFTFEEGLRGTSPATAVLGQRLRDDGGLGTHALTGFWVGTSATPFGRNPYVNRQEIGPQEVTHITYYAHVSSTLVQVVPLILPNTYGVYGAEACQRLPPTFECDPDLWWLDSAGNDVTPRDSRLGEDPGSPTTPSSGDETRIGVRVGQRYAMRDVDCIDSSFSPAREGGAHWGRLTQTRCVRP